MDENYRDAGTGQYVTEEYAKIHPDTTVRESDFSRVEHRMSNAVFQAYLAEAWESGYNSVDHIGPEGELVKAVNPYWSEDGE